MVGPKFDAPEIPPKMGAQGSLSGEFSDLRRPVLPRGRIFRPRPADGPPFPLLLALLLVVRMLYLVRYGVCSSRRRSSIGTRISTCNRPPCDSYSPGVASRRRDARCSSYGLPLLLLLLQMVLPLYV